MSIHTASKREKKVASSIRCLLQQAVQVIYGKSLAYRPNLVYEASMLQPGRFGLNLTCTETCLIPPRTPLITALLIGSTSSAWLSQGILTIDRSSKSCLLLPLKMEDLQQLQSASPGTAFLLIGKCAHLTQPSVPNHNGTKVTYQNKHCDLTIKAPHLHACIVTSHKVHRERIYIARDISSQLSCPLQIPMYTGQLQEQRGENAQWKVFHGFTTPLSPGWRAVCFPNLALYRKSNVFSILKSTS